MIIILLRASMFSKYKSAFDKMPEVTWYKQLQQMPEVKTLIYVRRPDISHDFEKDGVLYLRGIESYTNIRFKTLQALNYIKKYQFSNVILIDNDTEVHDPKLFLETLASHDMVGRIKFQRRASVLATYEKYSPIPTDPTQDWLGLHNLKAPVGGCIGISYRALHHMYKYLNPHPWHTEEQMLGFAYSKASAEVKLIRRTFDFELDTSILKLKYGTCDLTQKDFSSYFEGMRQQEDLILSGKIFEI